MATMRSTHTTTPSVPRVAIRAAHNATMPLTETNRAWTVEEIDFLLAHDDWPVGRLSQALDRTERAVVTRRFRLRQGWRPGAQRRAPRTLRRWTDAEMGFLADHATWPAARIAHALNRSEVGTRQMRARLSAGWTPQSLPWSESDEDFLLKTPHLTAQRVAELLGRTAAAVTGRRNLLSRATGMRFGDQGSQKSPFHIGARPLIAKTCPDCGLLLAAKWFEDSGTGRRRTRCRRCDPGSARKRRDSPSMVRVLTGGKSASSRASMARMQAVTRDRATRHGEPWITEDDHILSDPDLMLVEKALQLGRTYAATAHACQERGYKSKRGLGDSEAEQWRIDNPNAARVAG